MSRPASSRGARAWRRAALWAIFFWISFGLGYPTLSRYDPANTPGVVDARIYRLMALDGATSVTPPWRYRMTVPLILRGLHGLLPGRLGLWDPFWFWFLVINAAAMATAALLLLGLGMRLTGDVVPSVIGVLLFFLNFNIPNFHLAGLIDSLEVITLLLVMQVILDGRWQLLPLIAAAGTVVKETVLPLIIVFAIAWWIVRERGSASGRRSLLWIVMTCVAALTALAVNQSVIEGSLLLPWSISVGQRPATGFAEGLLASLTNVTMLYVFGWLVPLAAFSLRRFMPAFVWATLAAMACALLIGAWATIEGNVVRPMFNVGGPLLSFAAALTLLDLVRVTMGSVNET